MKYILYQNTSYERRFVSNIMRLSEWNESNITKSEWLKPILISTDYKLLKKTKTKLIEESIK